MRVVFLVDELQHHDAVGEVQRGLDGIGEPLLGACLDGQTVDHHLDVVLFLLLQLGRIGQRVHHAVDPYPAVALCVELLEQVGEFALAGPHHRGQHLEPGALRHHQHLVDDLLRGLAGDPLTADRAVRGAGPGVEQTQIVVDLGDGSDRRPRVAVGRLLVDRHRRGQTFDEVDVGFVHLAEELAGVGRQRFDVAPLALGKDRVERQRRLSRARQPGEDDQSVARQIKIDAAQVVLSRTFDNQAISHAIPLWAISGRCPDTSFPCYVPAPTSDPRPVP